MNHFIKKYYDKEGTTFTGEVVDARIISMFGKSKYEHTVMTQLVVKNIMATKFIVYSKSTKDVTIGALVNLHEMYRTEDAICCCIIK